MWLRHRPTQSCPSLLAPLSPCPFIKDSSDIVCLSCVQIPGPPSPASPIWVTAPSAQCWGLRVGRELAPWSTVWETGPGVGAVPELPAPALDTRSWNLASDSKTNDRFTEPTLSPGTDPTLPLTRRGFPSEDCREKPQRSLSPKHGLQTGAPP